MNIVQKRPEKNAARWSASPRFVVLGLLVAGTGLPLSGAPVLAAAQLASPPASVPENPTPPATPPAPEPSPLAKVVGRLSAADQHSARDWAELGRETASWGSRLQAEKQPVPEGPVRDALTAVGLGSKMDPKATDWPKLKEQLETLLKKPEEEEQQQQDQQDQNEEQQQQDQQKQDQKKQQKSDSQQQDQSGQPQSSPPEQQDPSQKQEPSEQPAAQPPEQKPGESAFGDMNRKEEPPPPPPQNTQKVGGAQEKKEADQPPSDPALALPLQKLEQLRNQDSPAQLFQLMEGDRKPATKKSGKDW